MYYHNHLYIMLKHDRTVVNPPTLSIRCCKVGIKTLFVEMYNRPSSYKYSVPFKHYFIIFDHLNMSKKF